ncbi:hypothetical protein Ancab_031439 [Ancistrocladus abbreviatus]
MASPLKISSFIELQYLCLVWLVVSQVACAQLTSDFYAETCPDALSAIKSGVDAAISNASSAGASLLRLHFHDCFVNLGGPNYTVLLGRRDSTTANVSDANADLPRATMNLSELISNFAFQGLSTKDLAVLSGGHTIGVARCVNFRSRIYNDTNINSTYAASLKKICPVSGNGNNTAPLEFHNTTSFDNYYYKDLLSLTGLLHSDQELYDGGSTDSLVAAYSKNISKFFKDFGKSMIKMGNIKPLTGSEGQIRTNCRKANSIGYM